MIENHLLITKKAVKENREIKKIQKAVKKHYKSIKGRFPKAVISRVVLPVSENSYVNMTNTQAHIQKTPDSNPINIIDEIEKNGLTGLSGNGFPTAEKIRTAAKSDAKEKFLIVNGVECDPGLLHDKWLLQNRLPEIEEGIAVLAKALPFKRIILATKEICTPQNKGLEIRLVPNRYPMGEEKILINHILDSQLAKDDIPAQKGILVLNIQTLLAISEIAKGIYQTGTRYITAADFSTGEAVVAKVNAGTSVGEILNKTLGIRKEKPVFAGGGLMQGHKIQDDETVSPTTNFVAYGFSIDFHNDSKCKKCGGCTKKCPMGIKVHKIIRALEKNPAADVSMFHPEL